MLTDQSLSVIQLRTAEEVMRAQNFTEMNCLPVDEPIRPTAGPNTMKEEKK